MADSPASEGTPLPQEALDRMLLLAEFSVPRLPGVEDLEPDFRVRQPPKPEES